jgi:two-component system phosphate regulon sensor histidine kinase PhoR
MHKILVIDDEEVVLDSCTQVLAAGDCQVATASNGAQGLKLVEESPPDLIFVDLKMPGLSGFEVLERIHGQHPLMVVIVITGYATVSSAIEAMKKGAFDFLPKTSCSGSRPASTTCSSSSTPGCASFRWISTS